MILLAAAKTEGETVAMGRTYEIPTATPAQQRQAVLTQVFLYARCCCTHITCLVPSGLAMTLFGKYNDHYSGPWKEQQYKWLGNLMKPMELLVTKAIHDS